MLLVQDLRKEFTNVVAVDGVSFAVQPGEIFGLIGPNGAGKSTTIRMIMDILKPDRGSIMIDGRQQDEQTRNIIGYLPEERGLYKKNKLVHVIEYFGALRGMRPQEARAAATPWLERFSLMSSFRRSVEELSKGNQQKVQFIISILHQPKLVVLDELFSGLDPVNQNIMKDILHELKESNTAVIFSTHQMAHAERLCDELMMIHMGKTVLEGTPSSIKRRFGKNHVEIGFTGSASVLREIQGVNIADLSQNHVEFELKDGVNSNAVLEQILDRVEVTSFARVEPSLQSIFLEVAGDGPETQGTAEGASKPAGASTVRISTREKFAVAAFLISLLLGIYIAAKEFSAATPDPLVLAVVASIIMLTLFRLFRERKLARHRPEASPASDAKEVQE